ncbi:odorant receptor 82a-like [Leptopilina boulardi]|uniref:odorant receptor 82a-like n=1 Tax=Leptopilina boulardi TaxID=63433 RepID=UPI0021F540EC|nr:odorant receptor 82a-like [Leptopilina boulardi]
MFPLPIRYFLGIFALWPGNNNNFLFYFFTLLSIISLTSQFWHVTIVYDNLELLSMNISNIVMILTSFLKIAILWKKRRYVKDVLIEMIDDLCQIKKHEELIVMKNHVKFSRTFSINAFIIYNFTIIMFIFTPLQTYYFGKSVENRFFPLLAKFPFSYKFSPVYEIIYFLQAIFLLLVASIYSISDSSYAAMVLHAATKLEIIRFELDNFFNKALKSEKKLSIKVLIEKHYKAIQFAKRVDDIFSGQLFLYFILLTLQFCFNGFIYLTTLSDNKSINMLLKDTFVSMSALVELGIYCLLGEYLLSKCFLIAECAYFIPWYELQCSDAKIIMMFIKRAQKPLTITAGKFITVSHFTFVNVLKTSLSYLSVLRAARN